MEAGQARIAALGIPNIWRKGARVGPIVGTSVWGASVGISVCRMLEAEDGTIVGAGEASAVTTETAYASTLDQAPLAITTQPNAEFGHAAPPLKRFLSTAAAALKFEPMRHPGSEEE